MATSRPVLSSLVAATDDFANTQFVDDQVASVTVGGTATIPSFGIPVVWVNGNTQFEVYVAQDISAVTGSPLPNGEPIAVLVGEAEGIGFNISDSNLSAGDITATAIYGGKAKLFESGIVWGSANAGAQTLFKAQLAEQGITMVGEATTVSPTYQS